MKLMTMEELHARLKQLGKDDLLLDVRTPEEFAEARIEGSTNIPHDELGEHLDTLKKFKTLYVYCRSGNRAKFATQALKAAGIDENRLVCIGTTGMMHWLEDGYPVVSG